MKSFAQDLVFGVTRGMIKPPKQILLSYTVKTLTNNVELLSILNRYGHGVSYSQLEDAGERQRPKPSLRSKRFQSSYCAKVRAEAKKRLKAPPSPSFMFFCSCPSFLDEPREETLATQATLSQEHMLK